MQIYNRWDEDYTEAFWNFMDLKLDNYQDIVSLRDDNMSLWKDVARLGAFFEGLGTLVKMDLLDIRYVAYFIASTTRLFWEKFAPIAIEMRKATFVRNMSETEYLYNELMRYMKEHPELAT